MNKPDTNSEIKAETITQGAPLFADSELDPVFEEMISTPFIHWERASFTVMPCDYCGQRDCQCD